MTAQIGAGLDDFPIGLLVTDTQGKILYGNRYMVARFGFKDMVLSGRNIGDLFSAGARIIYQSYFLPLVLHERHCEEISAAVVDGDGSKVPVTLNASLDDGGEWIYWCISSSAQRDKLDQELVDARRLLEKRAEELQLLSTTDQLTGLLSRRELKRLAKVVLDSGARSDRSMSLLVLDIDLFKQLNDEHGHSFGDRVLEKLGNLFRRQARSSDLIGRYGGEEFVFVLPDTDSENARSLALRLHAAIGEMRIDGLGITVSIGGAGGRAPTDFDTLFKEADQAMYQAKSAGRNATHIVEIS